MNEPDPSRYFFDEKEAERACGFFRNYLTLTTGPSAGKPFELMPWARDFVRQFFGWKRRFHSDDCPGRGGGPCIPLCCLGTRKYRRAGVYIPRKNAKTTLGAGLGDYFTFADREPGARVYSVAGDKDQAALMFDDARRMVEASPDLSSRSEVFRRSIVVNSGPAAGSAYYVVSSDAKLKHGLNPSAVLFDELHAQPDRRLWEAFSTSQAARKQPALIWISTAGYETDSLCYEQVEYARKVRDGVIDDPDFLPVIFESDKDDDWTSEDVWRKVNPGIGYSIGIDYYQAKCREAKNNTAAESEFRRFYLNQWVEARSKWLPDGVWDACHEGEPVSLNDLAEQFQGRECFVGMDLSTKTDVTAVVYVFPSEDGSVDVLPRFFIPTEALEARVKRDRVPYDAWERSGFVIATEGNAVDYEALETQIGLDAERFKIVEVAFDPWNATATAQRLTAKGLTCVEFRQGYASMSEPVKNLEVLIRKKKVRHHGNPVLRWMVSNASLASDPAGNVKLIKPKPNSPQRIDGAIGLVMGTGRAGVHQPEDTTSVYESRGLLAL